MAYLLLLIILLIMIYFFNFYSRKEDLTDITNELFPTREFIKKENIKSARCPQCGKNAKTYNEVKKQFGLRKVGYATDIQSWCRKCRRNKEKFEKNKDIKEELKLFNE